MTKSSKIDRTRRNLFKAATLVGGALVATAASHGEARAQGGNGGDGRGGDGRGGNGGGNGGGGYGGGGNDGGKDGCFRRGTWLLTVDGYRPIETLTGGDRLATQFSGTAPIKTITAFTMTRSGIKRAWPEKTRPVIVKCGALGDNLPTADLCLTASHAVFRDGFLVPVGDLVNDVGIAFDEAEGLDVLEFFHVELAKHDVIYANGAPCESLRYPAVEPCAPVLTFNGGRGRLKSRLRSAASVIVDRRRPLDVIRDELEERVYSPAHASYPSVLASTVQ